MIEKFKILIVDDVKENLFALNALLQREDAIIFQAESGTEALELMMKNEFCLAFLDVQMPGMNGFELAQLMRGPVKTKDIPIIFVTATATDQSFLFQGYGSGAVDFLLKPLDAFAVISKASFFIEHARQKNEMKRQLLRITELATDLTRAKSEAESANNFKTQFLANMSHEIRTPLGAILGFLDLLKNPVCSVEDKNNYMTVVERNSQQLLSLIDDILDLSKVESGKISIENIQFSLADMLGDLTSHMTFRAAEKGILFKLKAQTLIPDVIASDPVRLRQILGNIIGNAIKFTTKGHVELIVAFKDSKLQFTVNDTGVGITEEQSARLFQAFSQANASTTRKFGGTGLGLVLSRRLSEALGGKLELLASREDTGSSFIIEIKAALLENAKLVGKDNLKVISMDKLPPFEKGNDQLKGLKVLLVEDSPDNQLLITKYLNYEGATVMAAANGSEGVLAAQAGNYDVLLMDIQMPVLDGHEATRKLRKLHYTKPIVALTAHAMKEEQARCIDSGFTDFLTKPIQKELLIGILSKYVVTPQMALALVVTRD